MSAAAPPPDVRARERPRRLDAVETVFQSASLSLRRGVRGGRMLFALVIVLVIPLAITLPVSRHAPSDRQVRLFYDMLSFYHFGIAVPGVALAFATAFPWPEAEEGTLTWWFTAPVRRWAVHLGRFAAAWLTGVVVLPLSVAAIAGPLDTAPEAEIGSVAATAVGATMLAYPAYLAVFWAVATTFRKGLAVGVSFVLVENLMSVIPSNLVRATVIHYVRSLVHPSVPKASSGAAEALIPAGDLVAPSLAALVLGLAAVSALVLSLLLVEWIEYRGKTSQAT